MRSSHFIFFCLLIAVFYLLSVDRFHSPPQLFASYGRPARKYLGTSFSNPESEYRRVEVHEEEFNRPSTKDISSNTPEYEASIDSLGEFVYHRLSWSDNASKSNPETSIAIAIGNISTFKMK